MKTHPAPLATDPDVQRDRDRRRHMASLLWASRRMDRDARQAAAAAVDALVDLRVTLHQATAWQAGPVLPEQ